MNDRLATHVATHDTDAELTASETETANTGKPNTSRLQAMIAAVALGAAALTGCATKTTDSTSPAPTVAKEAGTSAPNTTTPTTREDKETVPVTSFADWAKNCYQNLVVCKQNENGFKRDHGAFLDHGSDPKSLRVFRLPTQKETTYTRLPNANGKCDAICMDATNESGVYVDTDPYCKDKQTSPGNNFTTVYNDYLLKNLRVQDLTFTNLGNDEEIAPRSTKHLVAKFVQDKTCADLAGTRVVRPQPMAVNTPPSGPYASKEDLKNLSDRVDGLATDVHDQGKSLEELLVIVKNSKPVCDPSQPDTEICKRARALVRKDVYESNKADK